MNERMSDKIKFKTGDYCWVLRNEKLFGYPDSLFDYVVQITTVFPDYCVVNAKYGHEWHIPNDCLLKVE